MKYDVHIYAVARIKVSGIEANSQQEAIREAEKLVDLDRVLNKTFGDIEVCSAEEIQDYLVDEVGDAEYQNTKTWEEDVNGELVRPLK